MADAAMLGTSGYDRNDNDRYFTEYWCTLALAARIALPPLIWEPAAGRGHMAAVLEAVPTVARVFVSDLVIDTNNPHRLAVHAHDFLGEVKVPEIMRHGPGWVVTNPPYDRVQAFWQICQDLRECGQIDGFALLLRHEWDSASGRAAMVARESGFQGKIVLQGRPRWDHWWTGEPPRFSPRHVYAWYVWATDRHDSAWPQPFLRYCTKAQALAYGNAIGWTPPPPSADA